MTLPDPRRLLTHPRHLLIALLLGAAALYAANLADPFVSDDWHHLWIAGHRTQPLLRYFLTNYEGTTVGGSYRPFVNVLWAIVTAAGGGLSLSGRLVGHGIALALHLACIALLFRIGRQLVSGRRGVALGALAATLFALFPDHPEAVNWVGAASDPAATAGVLGAISLYLSARAAPRPRAAQLVGMAACFAAALLAKETAIVLPAVLALHLALTAKRPWQTAVRDAGLLLAPLAALLALYVFVRWQATGLLYGYYGAVRVQVDVMVAARTFLAIPVSLFVSGISRTDVMNGLYGMIDTHLKAYLLALAVPLVLFVTRARRVTWWLAASFLVSIVPVMQFGINHLGGSFSDEGERYAYLPSAFAALLLAWVGVELCRRFRGWERRGIAVALALFLTILAIQLADKNVQWFRTSRAAEAVAAAWPPRTAQQVFVYGLPDNALGVPMWRNGFAQRLEAEGKRPAQLLVSDIRTIADPRARLAVEDGDDGTFSYGIVPSFTSAFNIIVGPLAAERTPTSYGFIDPNARFEIYALSYRRFADKAVAEPAPSIADAAAAFWTGAGWDVRPLSGRAGLAVE